MNGTTARQEHVRSSERRGTARALQAWQAAYWTRDELPARDDLAAPDGAQDSATFFVAIDRDSGDIIRSRSRACHHTETPPDLADMVPQPVLPHLTAAIQRACATHRPVPCSGALETGNGDTLMWRSIFLPLRESPADSHVWLYAAFGCKRGTAHPADAGGKTEIGTS